MLYLFKQYLYISIKNSQNNSQIIKYNLYNLDKMRRSITPKKKSFIQQQRNKNIPISQMIGSLLTATSTQYFAIQNNIWRFNSSKSQVVKYGEFNLKNRPQTSKVGTPDKNTKDQIIQKDKSPDRKSLRPRSSIKQETITLHKVPISNQINQRQFNTNNLPAKPIPTKCQTVRNYQSLPHKQGQIKVQYKLVNNINNDNLVQKTQNKPPKSIKSTKSIGYVRGYGVNSHKFNTNSEISEGRILIIANLTKTAKIEAITSLYAIFQSNKSISFIEFVRQQFQMQISRRLQGFPLPVINKQLIESCLHKVQNKFCEQYNVPFKKNQAVTFSITNNFGLSYSMIFVRNQQIIICTKGKSEVVNSINLGAKLQGQHSQNLFIRRMNRQQIGTLDFIALISEGMSNYNKDLHNPDTPKLDKQIQRNSPWIQRQLWHIFLQNIQTRSQNESKQRITIHQMLGNSIDSFFTLLQNVNSTKNMSIVLIAFRNLQNMLVTDDTLDLPYAKQCTQDLMMGTQTILNIDKV